jgi:hypothetical protein
MHYRASKTGNGVSGRRPDKTFDFARCLDSIGLEIVTARGKTFPHS